VPRLWIVFIVSGLAWERFLAAQRSAVVVALLIWISGFAAAAQPLPRPLDQYHVRAFTLADGLPVGDARHLAQPANGPVYVSTARGLAAFDGYAFHTVPLPGFESQVIETAHLDRAGRLWLLTKKTGSATLRTSAST
jgi:ligand-binding sensor domain-containing protein